MRVKHVESLLWLSKWHHGGQQQIEKLHRAHLANVHQLVLAELGGRQYERVKFSIGGVVAELSHDQLGPQDETVGDPESFKGAQVTLILGSGKDSPLAGHNSSFKIIRVKYAKRDLCVLTEADFDILESQLECHSVRDKDCAKLLEAIVPVRLCDRDHEWYLVCGLRDWQQRDASLFGLHCTPYHHQLGVFKLSSLVSQYSYGRQAQRDPDWLVTTLDRVLAECEAAAVQLDPPIYDEESEEAESEEAVA